jgi:hypothetical protein
MGNAVRGGAAILTGGASELTGAGSAVEPVGNVLKHGQNAWDDITGKSWWRQGSC